MNKNFFANRFGLAISFVCLSLFPSTFAWAGAAGNTASAQGPQQVVVANTAAQPVPVSTPSKDYFQSTIDFTGCTSQINVSTDFTVPAGKKLALQYVNVLVSSISPGQTFNIVVQANQEPTKFWLPLSPIGGFSNNQFVWAGHHNLLLVTDKVHVVLSTNQISFCIGSVTVSGELVSAQ